MLLKTSSPDLEIGIVVVLAGNTFSLYNRVYACDISSQTKDAVLPALKYCADPNSLFHLALAHDGLHVKTPDKKCLPYDPDMLFQADQSSVL